VQKRSSAESAVGRAELLDGGALISSLLAACVRFGAASLWVDGAAARLSSIGAIDLRVVDARGEYPAVAPGCCSGRARLCCARRGAD
jgi:hypothetical protein